MENQGRIFAGNGCKWRGNVIKLRGSMEYGDVPKWLKGPDSKSGRRVLPVLGFESPHLRQKVRRSFGRNTADFFLLTFLFKNNRGTTKRSSLKRCIPPAKNGCVQHLRKRIRKRKSNFFITRSAASIMKNLHVCAGCSICQINGRRREWTG